MAKARKSMDVWALIEAVLSVGDRLLFYGPPGTGKTFAGNRINVKNGQKVYNLTMTPEMSSSVILGHYLPNGKNFIWKDGPAITAWREGARLVLNEIDHASGDVETLLHAILDDPSIAGLTLPTGEFVRPKDGFQVIATMNGVPEDLPFALRDRFPIAIEVNEPHPDALLRLPNDLREVAKNTISFEGSRNISIRAWMEYAKLREIIEPKQALRSVFGDRSGDISNALSLAD